MIVILMGVSGSGKSTIGTLLSRRTGATFADADDYHPQANKEKMASGHALDDADRQPWLEELNRLMLGWFHERKSGVLACSALKQKYRETLIAGMPPGTVHFVLLDGSRELLSRRLTERHHEFMSANLLDSQLQTLEVPDDAFRIVNDREPAVIVDEILSHIGI
jgi:gluconokinase